LERAVLLVVNLRRLGVHRRVSNAAVEVDADPEAISVRKTLLDAPQLQAIVAQHGAIRGHINAHCLPSFFRRGVALVPIASVETVDAKLVEFHGRREALVNDFIDAYPDLVRAAQTRLRGLFDPRDYPAPEAVRAAFGFEWRYVTLNVPTTLAAIDRAIFVREREKAAQQWDQAARDIQTLLRTNMAELVSHMQERLTPGPDGQPKAFRVSTVNNLSEFLQTFDARNIVDDRELAAVVARARALLQGVDPQTLRRSDDVRETLRSGFTEMQRQLDRMVTNRPARRIVLERPPQQLVPQAAEVAAQEVTAPEIASSQRSSVGAPQQAEAALIIDVPGTITPNLEPAPAGESNEQSQETGDDGNGDNGDEDNTSGSDEDTSTEDSGSHVRADIGSTSLRSPSIRGAGRNQPDGSIALAVKTTPEFRHFCAARQRAGLPWVTADHSVAFEAAYQAAAGSLAGLDEFTPVDFAEAARLIESGELRWGSVPQA